MSRFTIDSLRNLSFHQAIAVELRGGDASAHNAFIRCLNQVRPVTWLPLHYEKVGPNRFNPITLFV
jgi:hypothetical protein